MSNDVIIVGGGLAGLFCALKLAPRPVTLLTAAPLGTGASSAWAQGGIAAAVADGDTPEAHARDTIAAGAGIVDAARALAMAREAPARIDDLLVLWRAVRPRPRGPPCGLARGGALGAPHRAREGRPGRARDHGRRSRPRLPTRRRSTLLQRLRGRRPADAATAASSALRGAHRRRRAVAAACRPRPSCSRPAASASSTRSPPIRRRRAAPAWRWRRAPARCIADPEFVQFHPTAIAIGRDPAPLATEALRGEGATLVNSRGERFMQRIHPDAELAPRDIVARGVFAEIAAGRGAFLDARKAIGPTFAEQFPSVYASCMAAGIDPARDLIPIAPAEHYHMGGDRGRRARTHLARRPVGGRRSRLDRRARRQPAGVELAARSRRVRRARRRRTSASGLCRPLPRAADRDRRRHRRRCLRASARCAT